MKKNKQISLFTGLLGASLAILLRLAFCFGTYNYDMESYTIVSELALAGANVYEETSRYNYGFFWAATLAFCRWVGELSGSFDFQTFRIAIVLILAAVDVALAGLLCKRYGMKTGLICLFFPTSVLLTGYHSQMDNFAILWAYCSWIILQQKGRNWRLSAALLGFSLVQKHIFIFFPVWLLFSNHFATWREKIAYVSISYGIFLGSFLPFLGSEMAAKGILENVFGYNSAEGVAFLPYLMKKISVDWHNYLIGYEFYKYIFIGSLLGFGFYVKRAKNELFYLYLIAIVAFSSALVNQYLAIPVIALCINRNVWVWAFMGISSAFLLLRSPAHLGILPFFKQIFELLPLRVFWESIFSLYACQILLLIILFQRVRKLDL